jgi:hypothetical protein
MRPGSREPGTGSREPGTGRRAPAGLAALVTAMGMVATLFATVTAQVPGFGGTWRLDAERSKVSGGAGLYGLIGAGVPPTLHITAPANGTLVVESQINEGHARIYTPRGKTTTPVGQTGSITMMSKWQGRTLTSEGTQQTASGTTTIVRTVKEVYALSADGQTLTIEVTSTTGGETSTSALVFTRLGSVGACESWPTPCKRAPGQSPIDIR